MNQGIDFNADLCIGCHACIAACKMNHSPDIVASLAEPDDAPAAIQLIEISPIDDKGKRRSCFVPQACKHCPDAPCIEICATEALYRDESFGAVLLEYDQCIGCEMCRDACPHDAPRFFDDKLVKCDLCVDRLRDGKKTACEQTCPAGAISVSFNN